MSELYSTHHKNMSESQVPTLIKLQFSCFPVMLLALSHQEQCDCNHHTQTDRQPGYIADPFLPPLDVKHKPHDINAVCQWKDQRKNLRPLWETTDRYPASGKQNHRRIKDIHDDGRISGKHKYSIQHTSPDCRRNNQHEKDER